MKKLLINVFIIVLVGCQQVDEYIPIATETVVVDESSQIEYQTEVLDIGYDDFLEVLSANELPFMEEISSEESLLSVERKPIIIDEEIISVYEYNTKDKLEADASGISLDGSSISIVNSDGISVGVEISWISYPHFFKNNKLIVNYVGEDEVILKLLNDIFGSEFAGYNCID